MANTYLAMIYLRLKPFQCNCMEMGSMPLLTSDKINMSSQQSHNEEAVSWYFSHLSTNKILIIKTFMHNTLQLCYSQQGYKEKGRRQWLLVYLSYSTIDIVL